MPEDIDKYGPFKDWEKPDWDEYFMNLAFAVAMRSPDPSTKHGCVIVDKQNRPVSMGYNGPPPDCWDEYIPLYRPEKYPFMKHAEDNAMKFARRDLTGCIVYVTGYPCHDCFGDMLSHGISKVIYGPIGSACVTDETRHIIDIMNKSDYRRHSVRPGTPCPTKIQLIPFEDDDKIFDMIERTRDYLEIKLNEGR